MSRISIPAHVAVIPDGNRRWAKARGLTAQEGHAAAYANLKKVADLAFKRGVKELTGYVFSTENWGRAASDVNSLMRLAAEVVQHETQDFVDKGVRIQIWGSTKNLELELLAKLRALEEATKHGTYGTINLCFNYGGRRDILRAVRRLVDQKVAASEIKEEMIAAELSSAGSPDPDLIIRTGGDQRLSNFLLWESAYSELYFSDVLWPDFGATELEEALAAFARRQRRYGR